MTLTQWLNLELYRILKKEGVVITSTHYTCTCNHIHCTCMHLQFALTCTHTHTIHTYVHMSTYACTKLWSVSKSPTWAFDMPNLVFPFVLLISTPIIPFRYQHKFYDQACKNKACMHAIGTQNFTTFWSVNPKAAAHVAVDLQCWTL